ncbi:MAG: VIT1/CCC1 transporter family protein [Verrucomicrobia bacterium]|nr:VIT1/CCC1 transporter family protein [Verrucomicrobiota bacterium]
MTYSAHAVQQLLLAQRNEITEYQIYKVIARRTRDAHNRQILERIAAEELEHYEVLKRLTGKDVSPNHLQVAWYSLISRIFGLSFGLRLMEQGEELAEQIYKTLEHEVEATRPLLADEQRHEEELLDLIEEERIAYAGSMVLGLNDALMELTGALAGLTFALQNGRLIAITGFITGVAASMSMAASEFLSAREDADTGAHHKNPFKCAAYTGIAYILTVLMLIAPYLLLHNVYVAGGVMLCLSILIILSYNFYITTAKGLKLWRRFLEMAGISLCVALISFGIGMIMRKFIPLDL